MRAPRRICWTSPPAKRRLKTENQPITVRWWFDDQTEVRLTEYGPIITDAPLIAENYTGPDLAYAGSATNPATS